MTIKNTVTAASTLLLAMSVSAPIFANEAADGATECISAAEVEAMSDEDKANLTLPVCEDVMTEDETQPAQ